MDTLTHQHVAICACVLRLYALNKCALNAVWSISLCLCFNLMQIYFSIRPVLDLTFEVSIDVFSYWAIETRTNKWYKHFNYIYFERFSVDSYFLYPQIVEYIFEIDFQLTWNFNKDIAFAFNFARTKMATSDDQQVAKYDPTANNPFA